MLRPAHHTSIPSLDDDDNNSMPGLKRSLKQSDFRVLHKTPSNASMVSYDSDSSSDSTTDLYTAFAQLRTSSSTANKKSRPATAALEDALANDSFSLSDDLSSFPDFL